MINNKIYRWIVGNLIFLLFLCILFTLFFHSRLNINLSQLSGLDQWAIPLDIALAHTIVTVPLVAISFSFLKWIVKRIWNKLEKIYQRSIRAKGRSINAKGPNIDSNDHQLTRQIIIYLFLVLVFSLLTLYGVYRFSRLLLVDTIDFQKIIFGVYDHTLGFSYPTTFRFTFIVDQFEFYRQSVFANETLSKILVSIGALTVATGALVSFLKFFEYLSGRFGEKNI